MASLAGVYSESLPYDPATNAPVDRTPPHTPDDISMNDDDDDDETQLTSINEGTKAQTPSTPDTSPGAKRSYDPAALLNPRAALKKAKQDPVPKDIQNNDVTNLFNGKADESNDIGQGAMLERQHGVTKREAMPQKRPQRSEDTDDQDNKKRQKFEGGSKGGVIGQYVKEKRQEGQDEAGPANVVDLTEDDDVTIVSSKTTGPDPNREVCLGTIDAEVNAHRVPAASKALLDKTNDWPATKVTLGRNPAHQNDIPVIDKLGNWFGQLELKTASAIGMFVNGISVSGLRWNALLSARPRRQGERPGQHISEVFTLKITWFARAGAVVGIGNILMQRKIFLSQPIFTEGKEVMNPHAPKLNSVRLSRPAGSLSSQSLGINYNSRTVEEVRRDVTGMFDKITSVTELPTMEADPALLRTELMDHQKQALYFLTQRETPLAPGAELSSPLWKSRIHKDGSTVYYNVISGDEVKKVDDSLGGIFADMMGLGKTLSILSRVAATLAEARAFGEQGLPREVKDNPFIKRNTRGTLIVCPKSVLSNWQEQIKAHLQPDKFSLYVYSGPNRETDIKKLAQFDIVIASYNTVAHEHSHNSRFKALAQLNWYRIVLDEAHMIRNQGTSAFKAACALESKRRWAVTGTPVQNRLDDLGALIKFVKISPFHEKGRFEQHFLSPFKTGDDQVLDNLRLLVDSVTLRRSKEKIDLPEKTQEVIRLDFSDSEQRLYEAFAKDSGNKMNALISNSKDGQIRGNAYAHMLTFITRLRLICAHGRELLKDEDMKMLQGSSYDNALDLGDDDDSSPQLTEAQAYNMFHMMMQSNMNFCNGACAKLLGGEEEEGSEEDDDDEEDIIGYMTPCLHVYCRTHIEKFKTDIAPSLSADGWGACPSCNSYIKAVYTPITRSGLDADQQRRDELRNNPQKAKNSVLYGGPHTKVKYLISRLLEHRAESDRLGAEEPPIRSVVFTEWTHYLDLIEIALKDADIGYLRLDGKMSVSARTRVLEQFRKDPTIMVCLVSIKAGGQGLNFTAANKVYVMEPQFNPGAEMQAVDRVHRIGQTRDVEVQKLIMTDSFEEKILVLQKQKMELAALTEGKKLTHAEERKKKMADLRSLFK